MKNYILKSRQVPLSDSWDVIVAGGGPSGCTAAVAAAREGARTLLIEATGCLGGMGTSGLLPAWCPFSDGEKIIYRGLAERVFVESRKGVPHEPAGKLDWVAINSEHLKRVYDDLVLDAGVTVLFNTAVASVEKDAQDGVDAVLCANKAGLAAYRGKVFVDCTGDGDVAAWAGAEFRKGDETTGKMQPATHCFIVSGVDSYSFIYGPSFHPDKPDNQAWKIVDSAEYPRLLDPHFCQSLLGPGAVGFNAGHLWDVDGTDPESTSSALIEGRKLAAEIHDAFKRFHPSAFGGSYLTATAHLIGVRETRRVTGDYVLTAEDYFDRRSFPDEIGRNCYFIDIHTSQDELEKVAREHVNIVMGRFEHYKNGESHGIPYRCLTPRGLKNVLIAGRCISTDRPVQASIRVMPVCLVTGEAAGLAAAIASGMDKPDVHAVDTDLLRKRLKDEGAYLPNVE